jgi:dienelactone hydrolase
MSQFRSRVLDAFVFALLLPSAASPAIATAQDPSRPTSRGADDDQVLGGNGPRQTQAFLETKVKQRAARPIPRDRDAFTARREEDRKELLRCLGLDPLPARTPLHARITGTLPRDGYRIEKLRFESRPGFVVTALVYVPGGKPPARGFPVIVNPHGHWRHKKSEPVVQARAIAQCKAGYLAIVVDSPGHSFEGDAPIERRALGTHDDLRLTLAAGSTTGLYVWDLVRTVDWLERRPDADTSRIGITGASGGGLATVYAFAAEPRFSCAIPVVYATSLTVHPHNGCLCNHVPGTLQIGDRADVLAIRAPAPVLVIGAEHDHEFPPEGTRATGAKLKALWALHGAEDKVEATVFDSQHDYHQAMRELALAFFDRHLRGGDGKPRPEPKLDTLPAGDPQLVCDPDPATQVVTMRALCAELLTAGLQRGALSFGDVVRLNGGRAAAGAGNLRIDEAGPGRDHATCETEPGLVVPAVRLRARATRRGAVILLDDRGKAAAAGSELARTLGAGLDCWCVEPRGAGELAPYDLRLSTYLGESVAFGVAHDAAAFAKALCDGGEPVAIAGRGPVCAQAALLAAHLELRLKGVLELDALPGIDAALRNDVPVAAIQPRAALGYSLVALRRSLPVPQAKDAAELQALLAR